MKKLIFEGANWEFPFMVRVPDQMKENLPIRRINLTFNNVLPDDCSRQISLFENVDESDKKARIQDTVISIKHKFGKNAILKGMNLLPSATTMERNLQIGGHKSG